MCHDEGACASPPSGEAHRPHRLAGAGGAEGSAAMSAAERSEPSFDAYASKVLDPDGAAPLDPCGCTVSGSYRRPQGVVMPRPIRASAALDWLDRKRTRLTSSHS